MTDRNANFKHGSQTLVTPEELQALTKSMLHPQHEEYGDPEANADDRWANSLYETGSGSFSAGGECEKTCRWTRGSLPEGTQTVEMKHRKEETWTGRDGRVYTTSRNHYVSVVPTTEGPHVVDFTHRQFKNFAQLPVVEHINDFMSRSTMKNYILDQSSLSPELQANLGE